MKIEKEAKCLIEHWHKTFENFRDFTETSPRNLKFWPDSTFPISLQINFNTNGRILVFEERIFKAICKLLVLFNFQRVEILNYVANTQL